MEWINVKDRLPDNDNDVAVTNGKATWAAYYLNEYDIWLDSRGQLCAEFTHWMPLPKPLNK